MDSEMDGQVDDQMDGGLNREYGRAPKRRAPEAVVAALRDVEPTRADRLSIRVGGRRLHARRLPSGPVLVPSRFRVVRYEVTGDGGAWVAEFVSV